MIIVWIIIKFLVTLVLIEIYIKLTGGFMKKMFLGIILLILSGQALSAEVSDAAVTKVGTYGNGRIFIALDKTIPETGCENDRFDIDRTHDEKETVVSIALAALVSGKKVNVKTSGCLDSMPSYSASSDSFFYVKN